MTEPPVFRRLRPTGYLPFIAWGLLCFLQMISPANAWSWLLVGLSVLIAGSYGWAWLLRERVSAERRTSAAWVVAGDPLREQFTLVNQGWLPALWARVRDGSALPGYTADRVESVDAHGERAWISTGACQRRGVFRIGPWDLQMSDPLGLFEVTQHYPATTTIMVYPRASHLPDLQLPRGRAAGRAALLERSPAETITVGDLRDYAPGDSLRRVHWRATARHDRLIVREFEREPTGDLWLILDLDAAAQAGQGAEATQEYAVILAASLAAQFTRQGERRGVGLLTSGLKPVALPPGRGQGQLWRILHALAEVEPGPGQPLAALLDRTGPILGNGRTLVVITPSLAPDWVAPLVALEGRGNAPAVILLDSDQLRSALGRRPGAGRAARAAGAAAHPLLPHCPGLPLPPPATHPPPAERAADAVGHRPGDPRGRGGGSVSAPLAWLIALQGRLRPREGWVIFALAWAAVLMPSLAAVEAGRIVGLGPLPLLATLGLIVGWWLGHRRWHGLIATTAALVAGVLADLVWGVHVIGVRGWPGEIAAWLRWWLTCGVAATCHVVAPALARLAEQWAQVIGFGQRVAWWTHGLIAGGGTADNLVLVGFIGLLAWGIAAWAGWWLARRGGTFVALLPTAALLAEQVYWADRGHEWLLAFLIALTLLGVLLRFYRLTREWEAAGSDYSPELRLETAAAGLGMAALAVILAPTLPFLTSPQLSEAFWQRFEAPYRQIEERLEPSFPSVAVGRSLVPPSGAAAGGLPRSHLLGGQPELGREVALRVRPVSPVAADPTIGGDIQLYWRGQTYARYDGRGWGEAAPISGGRSATGSIRAAFAAGEPWAAERPNAGRRPLLSYVEVVAASRAVLYAAGEPVSVDRPYHANLRAANELIALSAPDRPTRYTVLGEAAVQDPDLLRAAPADYPATFTALYLQLPPDLPAQLVAYATEITAGAITPYDRGLAIESALRGMEYSLAVPAPPTDQDVAAWFLFDLRRGYCDYFATAMVVLSRLSGIPARLAIGYATGDYDAATDAYVVTELAAHSWPELYFPGVGWVPFEPTPAQPAPTRVASGFTGRPPLFAAGSGDIAEGLAELQQLGQAHAAATARATWAARGLGAVNLLLLIWLVGRWRRLVGSAGLVRGLTIGFGDLARWGGRLGRPFRPADTPPRICRGPGGPSRPGGRSGAVGASRRGRRGRRGRCGCPAAGAGVGA